MIPNSNKDNIREREKEHKKASKQERKGNGREGQRREGKGKIGEGRGGDGRERKTTKNIPCDTDANL